MQAWTLSGVTINNCPIGVDMSNGGTASQTVGSVMLIDSKISNTPIGVLTAYATNEGATNGTLIIDNVDFSSKYVKNSPLLLSSSSTISQIARKWPSDV